MKFVTVTQLSTLGKSAIGFILGLGGLLQIPAVSAPVAQFVHYHPHYAFIIATITGLTTLLANPQVEKVIGYIPKPPAA